MLDRIDRIDRRDGIARIDRQLADCGHVFVAADAMRATLESTASVADWDAFAAAWDDLEVDTYLADSSRFRRRRFAVYTIDGPSIVREPHQPHFQYQEYNRLFGGIERWFAPVTDAAGDSASLQAILRFCSATFGALTPSPARWHVEVHQFRIEANAGIPGHPTPEGVHRDGVDYVLVLLVSRQNVVSGTTTIYDLHGAPLGTFTLTRPFDAVLVDDHRVAHGVTPVEPLDAARPGFRDVLVVTFRRQ